MIFASRLGLSAAASLAGYIESKIRKYPAERERTFSAAARLDLGGDFRVCQARYTPTTAGREGGSRQAYDYAI